jgi:uncharacterized protein YodC (DUF2158 family)
MAQQFQPGDTVRIKSGGPVMTVDGYDDITESVNCSWFQGQKRQSGTFIEATLEKATPFRATISTGRRVHRG